MSRLLLNCDIGESFGAWTMGLDAEVMPHIDCANIACGFHASDPSIMRRTVALAVGHGVRIGAHPAYPDLAGFGRRSMACSAQEVEDMLLYQIGALDGICRAEGTRGSYVKPHGALYNDMMRKPELLRAVRLYDPGLPLMLICRCATTARPRRPTVVRDLRRPRLRRRRLPGAVHHDSAQVIAQALTASDGSALLLRADSLCVHGDNASSVAAVLSIREALDGLPA